MDQEVEDKSKEDASVTTSDEEDGDDEADGEEQPEGYSTSDQPPSLSKLVGHDILYKFDYGWQLGKIKATSKARGVNFAIQWNGDDEVERRLLNLSMYQTTCSAPSYSWCVVSKPPVDWSGGPPKKKRRQ